MKPQFLAKAVHGFDEAAGARPHPLEFPRKSSDSWKINIGTADQDGFFFVRLTPFVGPDVFCLGTADVPAEGHRKRFP